MNDQQGSCFSSNIALLFQRYHSEVKKLAIKNLENIKIPEEVSDGELGRHYHQLHSLSLIWSNSYSDQTPRDDPAKDAEVLEKLRPLESLLTLRIEGYRDSTVFYWMTNVSSFLPSLVTVELANMPMCEQLPPFGQLEHLEVLRISCMPAVGTVDQSLYGDRQPFRKLKELTLKSLVSLEKWYATVKSPNGDEQLQNGGDKTLPNLQKLVVKDCPNLKFYSGFTRAAKSVITFASCSKLLVSHQEFIGLSTTELCPIEIENCGPLTDGLEILQYIQGSVNLKHLTISHYSNLITLPESIQGCRPLRELEILECWDFAELPERLGELTSLASLTINAAKLEYLPQSVRGLTSLENLVLKKCNHKLRKWCNLEENRDIIEDIARNVDTSEDPNFCIQSNGVRLLQKITGSQLIQLNIQGLNAISQEEAEKVELVAKEELCYLSLEWNKSKLKSEVRTQESVLEKLQPHHGLKRLLMKNYVGVNFPQWMTSLQNLSRIHFSGLLCGYLPPLEQLSNLKELQIADMLNLIWTTQSLKKLRRLFMTKIENIEWKAPASLWTEKVYCEDIFPRLEELQIHECQNLGLQPSMARGTRSCSISGCRADPSSYKDADILNWILSLSNIAKLELSGMCFQNMSLDLLQNMEELHISDIDNLEFGASLRIVTSQPLGTLRRIVSSKVENLQWKSPTQIEVDMFPNLEDLEIDCCYNLLFEPYFPRSSRYSISGSKTFTYKLPSFSQVMGTSASLSTSKMEIKYIDHLSSTEWEGLEHLDIAELTIEYCNDWYPLPKGIQNWKSLRNLEILNCENIRGLPDWLEEAGSLKYIKMETYGMKTLPPCIKRLVSLEELTLSKFNSWLEKSCVSEHCIRTCKLTVEEGQRFMHCSTSARKQKG